MFHHHDGGGGFFNSNVHFFMTIFCLLSHFGCHQFNGLY